MLKYRLHFFFQSDKLSILKSGILENKWMTERIWEISALFMKHIIVCKIFVCFEWLLQQIVHKTRSTRYCLHGCRGDGYNIEFNWLQSTLYLINWKALLRCILFRVPGINIISTVQNNNELLKDSLCVLHWMESSTQQTEVLKQQIKTCNALMSYLRVIVNQRVLSPKNSNIL